MNFSQFPLPTKILLGISVLLIFGIPFANLYIPYFDTASNIWDAYRAGPTADPHFLYRISIIFFGFALTFCAAIAFISSFVLKPALYNSTLNPSLLLFITALGFKNYPYWANGLLYAKLSIVTGEYDPKSILPQVILPDEWSAIIFISVLSFYLICWIMIPILLIFEFYFIKTMELKSKNILALFALALTFASFFATPEYLIWIFD